MSGKMNLSDFDYELPPEAIAKYPAERREDARLLILPRSSGPAEHRTIRDLPGILRAGDLLVVNDTKVQPWRFFGRRPSGGKVEILLVRDEGGGAFQAMVTANRPLPEGETILFPEGRQAALGPVGTLRRLHFSEPAGLSSWLEEAGEIPIPPYLSRRAEPLDRDRYQTVFAASPGAVAAPTAGLHLTGELIENLKVKGIETVALTLHVGPGTFRPVKSERIEDHDMDAEAYALSAKAAGRIGQARRSGGRIVAVGTTVVRVLETIALESESKGEKNLIRESAGETRLFIRPGHTFRSVDAMLTNFHLPRSTLLMLVAAFSGRDRILKAYREAQAAGYRFYSYGDAMLLE